MSTLSPASTKNRFAWLTPLQTQSINSGPWMLSEDRTRQFRDDDDSTVNLTVDALLCLLVVACRDNNNIAVTKLPVHECSKSHCGRFEVRLHHGDSDNTRLFVQQPTDYFQRLELFIDDKLIAAYQEPVWPHLQDPHALPVSQLRLPFACVEFLKQRAIGAKGLQRSSTSSNQASHADGGKSAAA